MFSCQGRSPDVSRSWFSFGCLLDFASAENSAQHCLFFLGELPKKRCEWTHFQKWRILKIRSANPAMRVGDHLPFPNTPFPAPQKRVCLISMLPCGGGVPSFQHWEPLEKALKPWFVLFHNVPRRAHTTQPLSVVILSNFRDVLALKLLLVFLV